MVSSLASCLAILLIVGVSMATLSVPCPKPCHCSGSEEAALRVDCSGQGLTAVPKPFPTSTTVLDLSQNSIASLGSNVFDGLPLLSLLNLSVNGMKYIKEGTFNGLTTLKLLDLQANNLNISDWSPVVPATVFEPLSQLYLLDISSNLATGCGYPEKMWRYFPQLGELRMDGTGSSFGDGFLALRSLHALRLSAGDIGTVTSETFAGLRLCPLETIKLENTNIRDFDGRAFRYIPTVQKLFAANNPLGPKTLDIGLGIKYLPRLKLLDLNQTDMGDSFGPLLTNDLCHSGLTTLTVSGNSIPSLRRSISHCLPELEVLSLSYNAFNGDPSSIAEMLNLSKIRFLYLNAQDQDEGPSDVIHGTNSSTGDDNLPAIHIAPTLEFMDVSNHGVHLPVITSVKFVSPLNVQVVRAANTGINNISGQFHCHYKPRVRELDISENGIQYIDQYALAHCDWSSLRILNMEGNNISGVLAKQKSRPFFKPLSGLWDLNLSRNDISDLDAEVFLNNTALTSLRLSGNRIVNFDARIAQMKELQLLDLSRNRIPGLSVRSMVDFLLILRSSPQLLVDLSYNPLQCSCENLYAIQWMANRQENFKHLQEYTCNFGDGTEESFSNLWLIRVKLEGECQLRWWFYRAIIGSLVVMFITTVGTLIFRWRFALEVSWYKPRSAEDEVEYEFDSFVVYNKRDKHWVLNELCRKLEFNNPPGVEDLPASRDTVSYKLCCHHRDFMIGMHIIDNVTEAFDRSRTTLIVMSNAALCGNWWQMELQMAVQTAVARRTNSLLFVFLEPLEGRLVTPQLRRILHTYTCKRWYPCDRIKQEEFWRGLKIAMKFPGRNGLAKERRPSDNGTP